MSHRAEQLSSVLLRALQTAIDDLSDPRIQGQVTITNVGVDTELTFARVKFVVVPESAESVTLHGLKSAAGHLRHELRSAVELRRIPQLDFQLDAGRKQERDVLAAISQAMSELGPEDGSEEEQSGATNAAREAMDEIAGDTPDDAHKEEHR